IKNGILELKGDGSISSVVNVDGTLDVKGINQNLNVTELSGETSGKIELGSNGIKIDNGTFAGAINGNGTLTKTGNSDDTLILSGVNNHAGATNIENGTLVLSGTIASTSVNVANGATLDVQGVKTLNNLASAGTVTFDSNLTLAGSYDTTIDGLDGEKNATKTGNGTTTLANNKVGKFVQQNGDVVLAGKLTGNYEQTAGNFVAKTASGVTTIDGDAAFDKNVELKNQLDVSGNLTLGDNATVTIDFTQVDYSNGAMFKVDDTATVSGNAIFNVEQWEPAKTYKLLSAETLEGMFSSYEVTFGNDNVNDRQGYTITSTFNELNLEMFAKNLAITRSIGGHWSDSNWSGSDTKKFYNGDYVTFNGSSDTQEMINVDSNVETAGMSVSGGKWSFSGNKITGKVQNGHNADSLTPTPQYNNGSLTVTGVSTTATFNNPIQFDNILVTEKARLNLPGTSQVNTGTLTVEDKSKLKIQAVTDKVTATGDVVLNGNVEFIYDLDPTKENTIKSIITTTNGHTISGKFNPIISDKLLSSTEAQLVNGNQQLDLVHTAPGVGEHADFSDLSGNTARIGDLIDSLNYADSDLLQELYGLENNEQGQEQFKQILLSQLGPELAADAMQLSLWKPYLKIFNRLHDTGDLYNISSEVRNESENEVRGQHGTKRKYDLWFEGYYRNENIAKDSFAGKYQSARGGMLTGIESYRQRSIKTGVFFGYGKPRVFNEIGRIEANDLTFGVYSRFRFGQQSFLNAFFAYGNQDYEYRHNNYRTSYNGESIYASIEIFRTSLQKSNSQLIPLFAIDFQKAWADGFTAQDTAQKIDRSKLDQMVLRMGLNSKFQPKDFVHFRTRLQYGVQVNGETYGSAKTSFLSNPGESRTLTGVNLGRNMFNVGVGFDLYSTKSKNVRIFADYDFDLGERSNAHTGQLGLVTTW
ncbi:MAG: autotransporter domain-containing protein, partial [Planctomycetaceae bacterium]|nr:autotransporter domain-containing protein [Planctomycetaceae bacterium]